MSATFKTSLQAPGDSIEYDITVTNAGSLDAKLDEITLSDTNNPAIKFTPSGMTKDDVIPAGSTKVLTVKVEYLSSVSEQPTNTTSTLTVNLDYSQATSVAPSGESAADKLIGTAVTTGDGLYEDTYEPGRYVYKGANPNNYITFNNEEWRIIAVEADGTLKVIRNESIGAMAWDETNSNNWERPATLNTYLNNDYYNTLSTASHNTNASTCKTTNYLVPPIGKLWTVTNGTRPPYVTYVSSEGVLGYEDAEYISCIVYPTLYLKSDITLAEEGTKINPYIIV